MRQQVFSFAAAVLAGWLGVFVASGRAQEKPAEPKSDPAAARIYQDAANAQNGMAFEIAEEGWRKLLKDFPKDPLAAKAQHYLGVCLLQQKKLPEAVAAFSAVVKDHPNFEFLEDALLNLASTQYTLAAGGKKELYPAAADSFAALLKQFPKGKYVEEALYLQGESLYAQETPEKKTAAVAAYEKLVKEHPKATRRADALYALGFTLEELGKYPEAGNAFDDFLAEFPDHALKTEVQMHKGETVFQAGDYAAAEKLFTTVAAVKGFASADHALLRQAQCLAKQKKLAEAGAIFAKIPTDFPQSVYKADATIAAGRSYYAAEKLAEAAPWLERAVAAKDAASPEAAHLLCRTLIRTGKPQEAADLAAAQLKAGGDSPFLVDLALDQADALYEIPAKRAESLPLYVQLATAEPPSKVAPLARYYAAFTALELKQDDAALKHAEAFIAAHPKDDLLAEVKYIAAESNRRLGKLPEAEKGFADLVATHADKGEIDLWRLRLALVLNQQKKFAETVALLTPLASKFKKPEGKAEAQFRLAAAQLALNKPAEAEAAAAASLAASKDWDFADEALL
ncbi:MAG: tetratricopeptide repeat protein, partial [Pirellulaceae bacterium]|nr:tetratricopeptide repeat protein [Pirellulaceae bacterium]